jgi:predicted GTPase
MAIDPEKFRNLRKNLDDIVELAPGDSDAENLIMDTVLGEALRETEELVEESRPPRMYVFGRSGAGKSSLINALANRQAADVGSRIDTQVGISSIHEVCSKVRPQRGTYRRIRRNS